MIEHGITTSTADFWLHIHPFDLGVYYYSRERCLRWIKEETPELFLGRSKGPDQPATGAGYKLPKKTMWLGFIETNDLRLWEWRHKDKTDREWGVYGQRLFQFLVSNALIKPPMKIDWQKVTELAEQYSGKDFIARACSETSYEIKTERAQTENLFVQLGEGGHQVHYTPSGDQRYSRLD